MAAVAAVAAVAEVGGVNKGACHEIPLAKFDQMA